MNSVKKIAFIICLLASALSFGNLPAPYDSVDLMPYNPQGWYSNGPSMEWLLKRTRAKVVIEVGSWLGLSTRHIAKTIPKDGVVYAVDHWLGSPNEDNSVFDIDNLYRQFLSNVIHENLTDKIIPIRMSSEEAAPILQIVPDLVYIDATHAYDEVYRDITLWYPFVKGHGVLCGDDYNWGLESSVKRAVDRFAAENNLMVHDDGWFWYYEEK
jgi:hypothetical protein